MNTRALELSYDYILSMKARGSSQSKKETKNETRIRILTA